jgi:hypothetical protein
VLYAGFPTAIFLPLIIASTLRGAPSDRYSLST